MMQAANHQPGLIGLTGGIGVGKSLVSDLFVKQGIPIIDTDVIAHQITKKNGVAIPALKESFGDDIFHPDGNLKRDHLRELAFSNPDARKTLEGILHPIVYQCVFSELNDILKKNHDIPYVIVVIPLLAETAFMKDSLDRVLLIQADQETQITRVMTRDNLTRENVLNILAAQANHEERLRIADDSIDNNGDIAALKQQVKKLADFYRTWFSQHKTFKFNLADKFHQTFI